jgi:hypothetical protein
MEYIGDMILQNVPKVRATHCMPCEGLLQEIMNFGSIGMGNFLESLDFGSCPSAGILETRKHNGLETGSVSVFGWVGKTSALFGPLERANLNDLGISYSLEEL